MMDGKLEREGKIALLNKEIEELKIRIKNRQNGILWAASLVHALSELRERIPDLEAEVKEYKAAFDELYEKQAHLKRLEEG